MKHPSKWITSMVNKSMYNAKRAKINVDSWFKVGIYENKSCLSV